jgi:hypothetical protein
MHRIQNNDRAGEAIEAIARYGKKDELQIIVDYLVLSYSRSLKQTCLNASQGNDPQSAYNLGYNRGLIEVVEFIKRYGQDLIK